MPEYIFLRPDNGEFETFTDLAEAEDLAQQWANVWRCEINILENGVHLKTLVDSSPINASSDEEELLELEESFWAADWDYYFGEIDDEE